MPVIDFREIPAAAAGARRDQFELFAREFLEWLGFKIVIGPDRGADAGRDLVVDEIRTGIAGETRLRWLVSCKHKAHSGGSVTPEDERDIHDRVGTHRCKGFLAFYSTLPSSGLATKLNAADLPFEVQIYDSERIEKHLLSSPTGMQLAQRFFPKSIGRWKSDHPSRARLFRESPELHCAHCSKDLLMPEPHGIVVVWTTYLAGRDPDLEHTERVYWCCKGACDRALRSIYRRKGLIDGWEDIRDLIMPIIYIRWVMAMLNRLHSGATYSTEALEKSKELLLNLFPLVSRDLTSDEKSRATELGAIPSFLGGLDFGREPER